MPYAPPDPHPPREREPARPAGAVRRLSSLDLFGASREIVIVHQGREYRLRVTQNDKLILTA